MEKEIVTLCNHKLMILSLLFYPDFPFAEALDNRNILTYGELNSKKEIKL